MEIIKLRKEVMRAAKWGLVLSLIIGGCTTTRHLPNKFHGTYYYGYNTGFSSTAFHFQGHTFHKKTFTDLEGVHEISSGTYYIDGDTLVLNYDSLRDPDPSLYRFIKRVPVKPKDKEANSWGSVRFKLVDHDGKPITKAVNLNLRSRSHDIIKSLQPDSLGTFPELSLHKKITDFMVSPLARKPVIIPTDTLNGNKTKVKVILSDSTTSYNKFNGIKKYLIEKVEKDKITLKRLSDSEKIILKRED